MNPRRAFAFVGVACAAMSCRDFAKGRPPAPELGGAVSADHVSDSGDGGALGEDRGGKGQGGAVVGEEAGARTEGGAQGRAGAAPADADGGAAVFGESEPTFTATCSFAYSTVPTATTELAFSTTTSGLVQLYAVDPGTHNVLVRWVDPAQPSGWTVWGCLDLVPNVTRLAAVNLSNNRPEVYAISDYRGSGDFLFVRRENTYWTPWLPMSLPLAAADLTDVDAVGGTRPRVYIVDRGRVFYRGKVSEEPYSDYGPWSALSTNGAERLAVAEISDGRHFVVTLSATGALQGAGQERADAPFSPWVALGSIPPAAGSADDGKASPMSAVDLEAVLLDSKLAIFVLDYSGSLWRRWIAQDAYGDWEALNEAEPVSKVVSIAVPPSATSDQVFGLDSDGAIYQMNLVDRAWDFAAAGY
jgi:hypothetical protein